MVYTIEDARKSSRKSYNKHKDRINKGKRQYYKENKERILKRMADKYKENPEKFKERDRKYCKNNRDKINIRKRIYLKTKRGKEINHRKRQQRRAMRKNVVENFTVQEWIDKKDATNGICPHCKKDVGVESLTLDHIFPISKAEEGRIYTINDIRPLCMKCNILKGTKIVNHTIAA